LIPFQGKQLSFSCAINLLLYTERRQR